MWMLRSQHARLAAIGCVVVVVVRLSFLKCALLLLHYLCFAGCRQTDRLQIDSCSFLETYWSLVFVFHLVATEAAEFIHHFG